MSITSQQLSDVLRSIDQTVLELQDELARRDLQIRQLEQRLNQRVNDLEERIESDMEDHLRDYDHELSEYR